MRRSILRKSLTNFREVTEIDVKSGIVNCDTAEDYTEALEVYTASIKEKADEIEKFVDDANVSMYTLRVHSLKSMSRLIGASELGDQAYELELAGKRGDIDTICKKTPKLIEKYRKLYTVFRRILDEDETSSDIDSSEGNSVDDIDTQSDTDKEYAPADVIEDAYASIAEFAATYDRESIDMVLDSLKEYRLSDEDADKIRTIKEAYGNLDWEKLREIVG